MRARGWPLAFSQVVFVHAMIMCVTESTDALRLLLLPLYEAELASLSQDGWAEAHNIMKFTRIISLALIDYET